jgi:hypothetical protein
MSLKTPLEGQKGWLGVEGFCSLSSVVEGILQGDNLIALENKP